LNKVYINIMFIVVFNLVLCFFASISLFAYQPMGTEINYNVAEYGFENIITDGFIFTGLALLGLIISSFVRINAFALIMFTEIFWFPYYKTAAIYHEVLQYGGLAFEVGVIGLFTTIMLFVFAYALLEMSSSTVVSG